MRQMHRQDSVEEKGSFCYVCMKSRKCMKSHMKVIHKIPKDCEDYKSLYALFTRQEPTSDDEDIIDGRELYLDSFERHQMGISGADRVQSRPNTTRSRHRLSSNSLISPSTSCLRIWKIYFSMGRKDFFHCMYPKTPGRSEPSVHTYSASNDIFIILSPNKQRSLMSQFR